MTLLSTKIPSTSQRLCVFPQYDKATGYNHWLFFDIHLVELPFPWSGCVWLLTYWMQRALTHCSCGVANDSRMIWRWLVVIGWAAVWSQQQGRDPTSRHWSASLGGETVWKADAGILTRDCSDVRPVWSEDGPLVNNSASGVCMLYISFVCSSDFEWTSRVVRPVWSVEFGVCIDI